jgi:hypothetical protein
MGADALMYSQCRLKSTEDGSTTTCWLSEPHKFVRGSVVSVKGLEGKWTIVRKGAKNGRKPSW